MCVERRASRDPTRLSPRIGARPSAMNSYRIHNVVRPVFRLRCARNRTPSVHAILMSTAATSGSTTATSRNVSQPSGSASAWMSATAQNGPPSVAPPSAWFSRHVAAVGPATTSSALRRLARRTPTVCSPGCRAIPAPPGQPTSSVGCELRPRSAGRCPWPSRAAAGHRRARTSPSRSRARLPGWRSAETCRKRLPSRLRRRTMTCSEQAMPATTLPAANVSPARLDTSRARPPSGRRRSGSSRTPPRRAACPPGWPTP